MHEPTVPFREALRVWTRVAAQSFGGPAGQIAVMHRILVDEKRWIGEARFLHALNYCMLLPGPEAQQLATYVGWLLHGARGGLVAGLLFVLPGFLSILALSVLYVTYGDAALVTGLFFGLKAAVLAVVVQAAARIGRRVLRNRALVGLAAAAFAAIFLLGVPFPAIVLGAAAVGLVGGRLAPWIFAPPPASGPDTALEPPARARPSTRRSLAVTLTWGFVWGAPVALLALALGRDHVLVDQAVFFSKAAVLTFGGAYAVLAYIAQAAVETYGWLQPGQMLDGLGMAETTPGPLIQVVQFVGFLGAHGEPGGLHPLAAGVAGSLVTTWVTFAPCFLWIFLGAPYVEALRGNRHLAAALSAITAAVVGVIVNLAAWFALHALFGQVHERDVGPLRLLVPRWESVQPLAVALTAVAFVALFRLRLGMLATLGLCAGAGAALRLALGA